MGVNSIPISTINKNLLTDYAIINVIIYKLFINHVRAKQKAQKGTSFNGPKYMTSDFDFNKKISLTIVQLFSLERKT